MKVRELTGDMQLTRQEIAETNIIVTTPEKWDVTHEKTWGRMVDSQVRLLGSLMRCICLRTIEVQ